MINDKQNILLSYIWQRYLFSFWNANLFKYVLDSMTVQHIRYYHFKNNLADYVYETLNFLKESAGTYMYWLS